MKGCNTKIVDGQAPRSKSATQRRDVRILLPECVAKGVEGRLFLTGGFAGNVLGTRRHVFLFVERFVAAGLHGCEFLLEVE